jgi:hypothetical protein
MKTTNSRLMIDAPDDFGGFGASVQKAFEVIEDRLDELTGILSATEDADDLDVSDIAYSSTIVGTSSQANAIAVGRTGATNPAFNVDCATSSCATGIKITAAAAAGGLAVAVISSGGNENLTIDAKGSGTIAFNTTGTGNLLFKRAMTVTDAKDIAVGTTTGSKIGTAVTQKIGFWNVTPVVQPASANQAAVTTSVTTTATTTNLKTTVANVLILLTAVRSALVNTGIIKGAA